MVPSGVAMGRETEWLCQRLAFYEVWEQLVSRISPALTRALDLDAFLQATVREVGRLTAVDRCNLMVWHEGGALKIDYEYLADPSLPSAQNLEIPVNRAFLLASPFRNTPYVVEDVDSQGAHPVVRELCSSFGTRSLLIIPINLGDQLLALLGLHHSSRRHPWGEVAVKSLASLGGHLALAFHYARLFSEKEREVKISHLLLGLVDEVQQGKSLDSLLGYFLDGVMDLVRTDSGAFGTVDADRRQVAFSLVRGRITPDPMESGLFMTLGATLEPLSRGEPVLVQEDADYAHEGYRLRKQFGAETLLLVPVRLSGSLFGVILLLSRGVGKGPSEEDRALVAALLRQAVLYLEREQLHSEVVRLRRRLGETGISEGIVGECEPFRACLSAAFALSRQPNPILIQGEPGSGRTTLAEVIHRSGSSQTGMFRRIACRGMSGEGFREALHGRTLHDPEGRVHLVPGALASTQEGTLFLHEIDCLDPSLRTELATWLAGGISDGVPLPVPGKRRRILISVSPGCTPDHPFYERMPRVSIPPLRERLDDLPSFLDRFLSDACRLLRHPLPIVDPRALKRLAAYSWPGNVAELRRLVEQVVVRMRGGVIVEEDVDLVLGEGRRYGGTPERVVLPVGQKLEDVEEAYLLATLRALGGDKKRTAEALGIGRKTLYRWLERVHGDGSTEISGS